MLLVGAFLGAGFVSGREIANYFSKFVGGSYLGIFFAVLTLFLLVIFFFQISNRVNSFSQFISLYFGKLKNVIRILFIICLLILIGTMFAGCKEVANSLNISYLLILIITSVLCYWIVKNDISKLSKINIIFMPLILCFICFFVTNNLLPFARLEFSIFSFFSGVSYIFINIVTLGVFIIEIGGGYTKKQQIISTVIFCLFVGVFLIMINNSIVNTNSVFLEMPMVYLANLKGVIWVKIMSILIWIGLFTTLISCVFVLKNILIDLKINEKLAIVFIIGFGLIFSLISFAVMVNYIYLIIGFIGLYIVVKSLKKERELVILSSHSNKKFNC